MSESTRPISTDLSSVQESQRICLTGDDGTTCIPITSSNVEIVASQDSSINSKARGSNKVKIQPVAKYDWEHKYYYGRLIAVSNSFLAYAIRGANSHAMIRVLSLDFNERTLLKGFTGAVTDLAFAHLDSSLLGCVDEAGNLMVWQLTLTGSKILYPEKIVVHVQRPEDTPLNSHRRLIWCPFILDDNEENQDDVSQTLALLHEDRAEVWDIEVLRANHSIWPVDATELKEGLITVKGHTQRVSEGALSPDGTVLATASHDGYIKFWQIYIEGGQDKPRCLHELRPHGGRPVSCLLFCDNHKRQDPEVPFWRFLITGADQNQELKMWCTVSWTCLQTIRFSPDLLNSSILPSLKASLDLAAEYLILTDVQRKVLYVMELRQDLEKGKASFTAVSEFLLTHPVLSFGVRDVSHSRLRHTEVLPAEEESESMSAGAHHDPVPTFVLIFLRLCVSRSLQDVQIWFQPHLGSNSAGFLSHSGSQEDHLTDQSSDKDSGSGSQTDLRKILPLPAPSDFLSNAANVSGAMPKLMTPDAFMTPSTSVPASPGSSASSLTVVTAISICLKAPNKYSLNLAAPLQALASPTGPLSLDSPQVPDSPLLPPMASPTRARSPDVISSASTALSQDMPEIASQTLQLQRGHVTSLETLPLSALQTDSMASAASALHMLTSPRTANLVLKSTHQTSLTPELGLGNQPSLLENALSQENPGVVGGSSDGNISHTAWPAAPDITRETRNSLRDNDDSERLLRSPFHRRSFHLTPNDNQDTGAEQSDPDDEIAALASSAGSCGSRSSHRIPVKDWKSSPRSSPELKRRTKKDDSLLFNAALNSLIRVTFDLSAPHVPQFHVEAQDELLVLLRAQQRDLSELLPQRSASKHAHVLICSLCFVPRLTAASDRRLDRVLAESQNHQQQLQEQLGQQLSHALGSALTNRMDKVLREELKKTVPQTISKSLEPVTGQLNSTIAAKLTAVEVSLKDNVSKVVKSKNTTDAIGRAAAEAMQGPIQAAYKDAFQSIVLPVFERGCQSMFQQINDSFKQGTHEYIQQLETHMKSRKQREQDARDPVIGQLQQMIDSFQSSTDQLASSITATVRAEVQQQMQIVVGNLQESILSHMQRIVKGEVSLAMKEQQAVVTSSIMQAMRSAAGTPVPTAHLDYQTQQANILQFLQQGQLNQAFQQALSATDLNLVLYVCETIDSQQVFGQSPCPLSQPVLLSLIQQLSSNLSTRSELKISYLEDAVMNLDHSDPLTRDHMASILGQVRPKLIAYLQQEPHSPLIKRARRLLMMLQGLVNH
uniref:Enhancer of mRNA-decapping protein 4 n=1 Tax=Nothobranchius furzeri TaxID=105023 RepID=A0A8C6VSA2_NOTFU